MTKGLIYCGWCVTCGKEALYIYCGRSLCEKHFKEQREAMRKAEEFVEYCEKRIRETEEKWRDEIYGREK